MARFFHVLVSDLAIELHSLAARENGTGLHDHLRLCLEADARAYGVEIGRLKSAPTPPTKRGAADDGGGKP